MRGGDGISHSGDPYAMMALTPCAPVLVAIESRVHMKIGLSDVEPNIARRIREMVDYMRTMEFQDRQHPHTLEREVLLAARAVLQRPGVTPFVLRMVASVGVGFLTLILVAKGINSGTIPGPMVIAAPAFGELIRTPSVYL